MMGIANARRNLNEGKMFTGSGAEVELTGAKLKALAGFPADPRIEATESFKAMVAPIVAQARQALAGGANISDNDMKIAEKAAGGNITLERGSINEILGSLERINTAIAVDHQKKVLSYTGTDPNSQRAMNSYFLPMERIVPEAAITRLIEHRNNPGAIKQFDDTFMTPGLAQKILQARGM
jgi:CO dehydrogenase/acetyl-CoA synthase delta subunit